MSLQPNRDSQSFLKEQSKVFRKKQEDKRRLHVEKVHEKTMIAIAIERFVTANGYNLQTMPRELRMHVNTSDFQHIHKKNDQHEYDPYIVPKVKKSYTKS